ncbi:MAG: hypothetical protein EA382_04240 [Spirochaetaceae bacterium]|nr:MAG: hypothetical protein EA382_04240 [Spirochaetaceae bacterium]
MNRDVLGGIILFSYYLVVCVIVPVPLKYWTRVPPEIIRKVQHIGYSLSVFLLLNLFSTWYWALSASAVLVVVAYPTLALIERTRWYRRAFADRAQSGGEFRRSLLMVQATFGLLIVVLWGLMGIRWAPVVGVAVTGWGFGDAAAALVGKAWGRRRVLLRWVDHAKTYEGTAAMAAFAAAAFFLTLFFYVGLPWASSLAIAVIVAPICAIVELVTRGGYDTFTVPIVAALAIAPLVGLFSAAGH